MKFLAHLNIFQQHYLGNKKLTFLACNNNQVYAAILEFPKIMIFFRTAKPTLARFLKYPEISLIWFLYHCKCSA